MQVFIAFYTLVFYPNYSECQHLCCGALTYACQSPGLGYLPIFSALIFCLHLVSVRDPLKALAILQFLGFFSSPVAY